MRTSARRTRQRQLSTVLLLLAAASSAHAAARAISTKRLGAVASGMLTLDVQLGRRQVRMAIDTGASRTMVSGELASELGLVAREQFVVRDAANVSREAFCAGPIDLDLDGVTLRSDCLGWIPGSRRVGQVDGTEGVLGFDALSSADFWIDWDHRELTVSPPGGLRGRFQGVPVELVLRFGRPIVIAESASARFASRRLRLVVDSGSNATALFGEAALTAARRPSRGEPRVLSAAYSRRFVSNGHLGRVRFGSRTIDLGEASLLSDVRGRAEDGVVPLARLSPVLFEADRGSMLVDARPARVEPR